MLVKKIIKGFFSENMHLKMAFYGLFSNKDLSLCNIF